MPRSNHFDLIVIGCGGVGSAVAYYAAKRNLRVLALEQFEPVHARGSSHGDTRVIRQAYFEHADYVPLLKRAYRLWNEFEDAVGTRQFYRTGLLEIGPESGVLVQGVRHSAKLHHLPLEQIDRRDFDQRFAGFSLPDDAVALFESNAGFLLVEECIRQYIKEARREGGDLRFNQRVLSYEVDGNEVRVNTAEEQFVAARLVVTAGAWANDLLAGLGLHLKVLRKHLHWYQPSKPTSYQLSSQSPTFFYETKHGYFYGFPVRDARGLKVAQHSGGETVCDATDLDRSLDTEERRQVDHFVRSHLPEIAFPATGHTVCMYTMSPDEHFIVDRHPVYPQISFAAGLSGHGFKFASVLGEILIQLATDEQPNLPIDFLGVSRSGLRS